VFIRKLVGALTAIAAVALVPGAAAAPIPDPVRGAEVAGTAATAKRSDLTAPLGSTKGSLMGAATTGLLLPYVEQDN
jgi:hypothetical protein